MSSCTNVVHAKTKNYGTAANPIIIYTLFFTLAKTFSVVCNVCGH